MNASEAKKLAFGAGFEGINHGDDVQLSLAREKMAKAQGYLEAFALAERLAKALDYQRDCLEFLSAETDPENLEENCDPMTIEKLHKHFGEELRKVVKALAAFEKAKGK